MRPRRFIGVYDADGTVRGELTYLVQARLLRTAHCSLCDITHGRLRQKRSWRECTADLGVSFDAYHRNDQPSSVRAVIGSGLPVVVAETDDGVIVPLLDPEALEACAGDPARLVAAVEAAWAAVQEP